MNKTTSSKPTANVEQEDKKEPLADQAKQAVSNVAGQVKDQVTHQLDARKETAVEKVGTVADALRDTSDKLKDIGPLGDVAGRAADGIQRVQEFFEDRQVGDIVRDVERFARREPALFLGGALALGLAAGRFLKSSSHANENRSQSSGYEGDDDYLSDDDFDYTESSRYGSMGSSTAYAQRGRDPMRTTQPMATPVTPPLTSSPGSSTPGASMSSTSSTSPASSGTPSTTTSGVPKNGSAGRV